MNHMIRPTCFILETGLKSLDTEIFIEAFLHYKKLYTRYLIYESYLSSLPHHSFLPLIFPFLLLAFLTSRYLSVPPPVFKLSPPTFCIYLSSRLSLPCPIFSVLLIFSEMYTFLLSSLSSCYHTFLPPLFPSLLLFNSFPYSSKLPHNF